MNRAVSEIAKFTSKAVPVAAGTAVLMQVNALTNPDAAIEMGVTVGGQLAHKFNQLLERFEKASYDFLGERRGADETANDFLERLSLMSEVEIFAMQRRNGILATKALVIGFAGLSAAMAIGGTIIATTAAFKGLGMAITFGGGLAKSLLGVSTGIGTLAKTVMTNPYVLAILSGGAIGYAVGTYANGKIDEYVKDKTGGRNSSLGDWLYDKTHVTDINDPNFGKFHLGGSPYIASRGGGAVQVTTQIHMDGRKVAEAVSSHQAKAASRPGAGISGFDTRIHPLQPAMGSGGSW